MSRRGAVPQVSRDVWQHDEMLWGGRTTHGAKDGRTATTSHQGRFTNHRREPPSLEETKRQPYKLTRANNGRLWNAPEPPPPRSTMPVLRRVMYATSARHCLCHREAAAVSMTSRGGCATGLHRGSKAWRIPWRLREEERTLNCRCELVSGGAEQGDLGAVYPRLDAGAGDGWVQV